MGRHPKDTKKAPRVSDAGVNVYIGKEELERLERQGALDLDEPIEYSVTTGVSDGRARAFVQLSNEEDEE